MHKPPVYSNTRQNCFKLLSAAICLRVGNTRGICPSTGIGLFWVKLAAFLITIILILFVLRFAVVKTLFVYCLLCGVFFSFFGHSFLFRMTKISLVPPRTRHPLEARSRKFER